MAFDGAGLASQFQGTEPNTGLGPSAAKANQDWRRIKAERQAKEEEEELRLLILQIIALAQRYPDPRITLNFSYEDSKGQTVDIDLTKGVEGIPKHIRSNEKELDCFIMFLISEYNLAIPDLYLEPEPQ